MNGFVTKAARKKYFTLLEVLTVLLILSFGIGLTGVFVNKMYKEQRFMSETEQVLSHLGMAQDMMLILDTDVKVIFTKDHNTFLMRIDVEKPFTSFQQKVIEREITLSTIKSIQFNGKSKNPLTLLFSLGDMSQGILKFVEQGKSDGRVELIALPGYPSSMNGVMTDPRKLSDQVRKMKRHLMSEEETESLSEKLFPSEVYEALQKDKQSNPGT
jgi:type II secretory pathway pseudopilin PulG